MRHRPQPRAVAHAPHLGHRPAASLTDAQKHKRFALPTDSGGDGGQAGVSAMHAAGSPQIRRLAVTERVDVNVVDPPAPLAQRGEAERYVIVRARQESEEVRDNR
jgi:hypothetical protein